MLSLCTTNCITKQYFGRMVRNPGYRCQVTYHHLSIEYKDVRGKVTAGGFRMKSIKIGCIEISDESLRSPGEGPEGKRNAAMSLSEHVLSSTCGACYSQAPRSAHVAAIYWEMLRHLTCTSGRRRIFNGYLHLPRVISGPSSIRTRPSLSTLNPFRSFLSDIPCVPTI
jgi:hypothetical protein